MLSPESRVAATRRQPALPGPAGRSLDGAGRWAMVLLALLAPWGCSASPRDSLAPSPLKFPPGGITRYSLYSPALRREMGGLIVAPRLATSPGEPLPVVYMLSGLAQRPEDWLDLGLEALVNQHGFAAVVPANGDKPPPPQCRESAGQVCAYVGGWYLNWADPSSPAAPSHPANFEDYIVKDVIPFIEARYSLGGSPGRRGILGISMGGYGAVRIAMKTREFAFAASHSGQLGLCHTERAPILFMCGNDESTSLWALARARCRDNGCGVLYFDVGTSDPGAALGAELLHRHLDALGIRHDFVKAPGGHDPALWRTRLPHSLRRVGTLPAR